MSSILEQRIRGVQEEAGLAETGRVLSVGYAYDEQDIYMEYKADGEKVTVLRVSMA